MSAATDIRCRLLLLASLAVWLGCGGSRIKTYRIPGKLVYDDGSPVSAASVVLQTRVGDQTVSARGMANAEGRFDLATFKEGDGVVAGEHEVSISPVPVPEGSTTPKPQIPQQYWDFSTSGLKTDVTPQTTEIVITINRTARK
jgi:hypothetical protein